MSFFTSNKDKIPFLSNSYILYEYKCPGCAKKYIGKTQTTLFNRTQKHGWEQKDSAIFKHFNSCNEWREIVQMFKVDNHEIVFREFQINAVRQSIRIVRKTDNWLKLLFLEALAIKEFKPELNIGVKGSKELVLF